MYKKDLIKHVYDLKANLNMRIGVLKKNIKTWRHTTKVMAYNIRLKLFFGRRSTWVNIATHLKKQKVLYLTSVYFILSGLVTWLAGRYVLPVSDATTFFTAAGGMIGAALAIILTFNTLIINFAGTEFPPEFYRAIGYDWRQNIIYFLLAADATVLFLFSLIFHTSEGHHRLILFPIAILLICLAFYILFASYIVTRRRLDPAAGLANIRNIAIKHLTKGAKAGDKLAKVFASNPSLKAEDKALARKEAYRIMAPLLERVGITNGYLHDYHDKLLAKQNYATAIRVLDAVYQVLAKYIEIRHDNMQARMTGYFLAFTTDSQDFFEKNLQQLVDKAKRYMDTKNATGAIHITDIMGRLAQNASSVSFGVQSENPLLDQIQGYLNFIADDAIAKKDEEVMFHLADVYAVIGQQAVAKGYHLSKSATYSQLVKIGQAGALVKQTSVTGRVASAFNSILIEMHNRGLIRNDYEPKNLFDEYQKVLMFYVATTSDKEASLSNQQMLAPFRTAHAWMIELAKTPAGKVERTTHNSANELAEVMRDSMRHMSGTFAIGGHSIAVEMGEIIQSTAILMLNLRSKRAWRPVDGQLIDQAHWQIHQLTWFMEKTKVASEYIVRELTDNAGYVGLRALETDTPKIVKASIDVISYLTNYYQEKAQKDDGYESARFMQNACLIGIYADKLGMSEAYELAKEKAIKFNEAFNSKHFPKGPPVIPGGRDYIGLHPDQLLRELDRLYQEPNYEFGVIPEGIPIDTIEGRFAEYIDRDDVQAFITAITPIPAPVEPTEQQNVPQEPATVGKNAATLPATTQPKKPAKIKPKPKKRS